MKEYYEGMFKSLAHNCILMMNQIEASAKYNYSVAQEELIRVMERLESVMFNIQERVVKEEQKE